MTHQGAARAKRLWWATFAAVLTVLGVAASVICATFVKAENGAINRWWFAGQIAGTLTAAAVPIVSAWRARRRESAASKREIATRIQTRLEMNEALDPIIRTLGASAGGNV